MMMRISPMPVAFRSLENDVRFVFPKCHTHIIREAEGRCISPKTPGANIEKGKEK